MTLNSGSAEYQHINLCTAGRCV